MKIEQKLDELIPAVKLLEPIFCIVYGYSKDSIRINLEHPRPVIAADLSDPINRVLAKTLRIYLDPESRKYQISKSQTVRIAYNTISGRLVSEVLRILGKKHPLTLWCYNYINYDITSESKMDIAETVAHIYSFVAAPLESELDRFTVAPDKVPQFIALMTALKNKFAKEKGWTNEGNPDARGRRSRRRDR